MLIPIINRPAQPINWVKQTLMDRRYDNVCSYAGNVVEMHHQYSVNGPFPPLILEKTDLADAHCPLLIMAVDRWHSNCLGYTEDGEVHR